MLDTAGLTVGLPLMVQRPSFSSYDARHTSSYAWQSIILLKRLQIATDALLHCQPVALVTQASWDYTCLPAIERLLACAWASACWFVVTGWPTQPCPCCQWHLRAL